MQAWATEFDARAAMPAARVPLGAPSAVLGFPQCQAAQERGYPPLRCPGVWLLGLLPFVGIMRLADPRTYETGRRGLIGDWRCPH